ncbi:MAG: 3-hydroxyisobutyrate dehydrogenase-like beta-hydroxyacid dehydrogenase, partial [Alphaproteobacteria bacterium]
MGEDYNMSKHIGIVGLGIMGSAISGNFRKAGYEVTGFDIAPERCDELASKGGTIARSPGEVAARADIVLTSLPSSAALDAVVSGDDGI